MTCIYFEEILVLLTSLRETAVIVYPQFSSKFLTAVFRVQAVLPTANICKLYGKLLFSCVFLFLSTHM